MRRGSHPEYLNPPVSEVATMVALDAEVLARYPRFSLYNSPYDAHDEGCAIDLYPQSDEFAAAVRSASDDPRRAESRRD
ncbi:hypothetical protein ACFO3H_00970, partial [Halorussus sp. GCM10023401]